MPNVPPIKDWSKYARLGIMKFRGHEPICHNVGNRCKKTKISAMDALEGYINIYSSKLSGTQVNNYQDKHLDIAPNPQKLYEKDIAKIIWQSFRFSQGMPTLQFNMIIAAREYYGVQDINKEKCENMFTHMLKVGAKHEVISEWEEQDWRPPHPKVHRFVRESHTDIGLSVGASHITISSKSIKENTQDNPFLNAFITGKGKLDRIDRDGKYIVSAEKKYKFIGEIIQALFEQDFTYLFKKEEKYKNGKKEITFPGRPNRKTENDGENNLGDRYFSYFIWYIVLNNPTGNEFFDAYFTALHNFWQEWFYGLPQDSQIGEFKKSLRNKNSIGDYILTREDILILIAQYNITHPNTQESYEIYEYSFFDCKLLPLPYTKT